MSYTTITCLPTLYQPPVTATRKPVIVCTRNAIGLMECTTTCREGFSGDAGELHAGLHAGCAMRSARRQRSSPTRWGRQSAISPSASGPDTRPRQVWHRGASRRPSLGVEGRHRAWPPHLCHTPKERSRLPATWHREAHTPRVGPSPRRAPRQGYPSVSGPRWRSCGSHYWHTHGSSTEWWEVGCGPAHPSPGP